ncbi:MAG: tRNA adenosine(34) deaminase TadA [Eubacteriales bacterium]
MNESQMHEKYMKSALLQAKKARQAEESPVGCVIVHDGKIIAHGYNLRQSRQDVTLHAEMAAIRKACRKLGSWRLEDCDLYVTLEPCYMCSGAIIQARMRHVYFGASDPKAGAVVSKNHLFDLDHNHHVEYTGGILEQPCRTELTEFFRELRSKKKARPESAI